MTYEMDGQGRKQDRYDAVQVAIAELIFKNGYTTDERLIDTLSKIKNLSQLKTFLDHYKFKTNGTPRRLR